MNEETRAIYRHYPMAWVSDIVGYHLSQDELNVKAKKYKTNPKGYGQKYFLDDSQANVLQDLSRLSIVKHRKANGIKLNEGETELSLKKGVSVMAGKGVGKSAIASMSALWFLMTYKNARVFLLAPKYDQLKNTLWAEINKWIDRSIQVYGDVSVLKKHVKQLGEKVHYLETGVFNSSNTWTISILTYSKSVDVATVKAGMAGLHGEDVLYIIDEASGVSEIAYQAIDETCTAPNNIILPIFNPNKNTGWAIETQQKHSNHWVTHRINAETSSLVPPEKVKILRDMHGADSNVYRIAVLGLPPLADEGSFISYDWIQSAIDRYDEYDPDGKAPLVMGLDIGFGGDKTECCIRKGHKILEFRACSYDKTEDIAGWFEELAEEYDPDDIYIDSGGVGQGVYDKIKADGFRPISVKFQDSAKNGNKFYRKKDEMAFHMREAFEMSEIAIPNDEELVGELSLLREEPEHSSGKFKLLSKKNSQYRSEMRGLLGYESPNKVDALMLTFYKKYSSQLRKKMGNQLSTNNRYYSKKKEAMQYAWMAS